MFRIAMIPVIMALFMVEGDWGTNAAWVCLGIYTVCAITDFFDGYLARKLNQVTPLGTFLDPISDKIFVACILLMLVEFDRLNGLWIIPVLIIFAREFLISGLREFLGPKNIVMPVTKLAKWKTTTQMLAIGFLIIGPYLAYTLEIGQVLLAISALLTAITGWDYLRAGLPHMR